MTGPPKVPATGGLSGEAPGPPTAIPCGVGEEEAIGDAELGPRGQGWAYLKEGLIAMWWGDGNWASWLLMSLMMVAFWGVIIALVVWASRGSGRPSEPKEHARSILEERFARGEIDEAEFRARMDALSKTGSNRAA